MKKIFILLTAFVISFCLLTTNTNKVNAGTVIQDGFTVNYSGINSFQYGNVLSKGQLAGYGITQGEDTYHYTFAQDLDFQYMMHAPFLLDSPNNPDTFYFVINGNVTLTYDSIAPGVNNPIFALDNSSDLVINGSGNTLTLTSESGVIAEYGTYPSKVTLNNIKLDCKGNLDIGLLGFNTLVLENGAELKVKNIGSGTAMDAINNIIGVTSVKGSTTVDGTLEDLVYDTASHTYKTAGGADVKYIELKGPEAPAPTPTPIVKDESCEKVIGPTWHWNNDKGICEEYATVGTSTR